MPSTTLEHQSYVTVKITLTALPTTNNERTGQTDFFQFEREIPEEESTKAAASVRNLLRIRDLAMKMEFSETPRSSATVSADSP
jgi:hypothetical protein